MANRIDTRRLYPVHYKLRSWSRWCDVGGRIWLVSDTHIILCNEQLILKDDNAGKNQADIHLVGFNVSPATNRSTLSPQMTSSATMPSLAPPPTNPPRMPSPQPSRSERIDPPRPSTSQSTRSVESIPASTAVPKLNIPSRSNVSPPINAQRPSTAPLSVNKSSQLLSCLISLSLFLSVRTHADN